jgi:hypothetical protein
MTSAAVVLACAVATLGRAPHTMPPVEFVEQPPPGVSRNAEAFFRREPDTIYLITSSSVFREAQAAEPRCSNYQAQTKLASIVAHELWHLKHGTDERGAYLAQLTTLIWLGYGPSSSLFSEVQASMLAVVTPRKTRRHVER